MRVIESATLAIALGLAVLPAAVPTAAQAQIGVGISVGFAPPLLPVYEQPPIPGYGYIWTPGYWAWSPEDEDYYWVPGTWVLPPRYGYLWTPAYWGYEDGAYVFNAGYWGPTIGFYGGINYGFGYNGFGYEGGYWRGHDFCYNRYANNITNININNTYIYNRPVSYPNAGNRVSFNGGAGGLRVQPTPQQRAALQEPRIGATPVQQQHIQMARTEPFLRASVNHGAPQVAATVRPAVLRGPGVMPAFRANTVNGTNGFANRGNTPGGFNTANGAKRFAAPVNQPLDRAGQQASANRFNADPYRSGNLSRAPQNAPQPQVFRGGSQPYGQRSYDQQPSWQAQRYPGQNYQSQRGPGTQRAYAQPYQQPYQRQAAQPPEASYRTAPRLAEGYAGGGYRPSGPPAQSFARPEARAPAFQGGGGPRFAPQPQARPQAPTPQREQGRRDQPQHF